MKKGPAGVIPPAPVCLPPGGCVYWFTTPENVTRRGMWLQRRRVRTTEFRGAVAA